MDRNPFKLFDQWFADARAAGISAPEAMTLATATRKGLPSARIVLLKAVSRSAFVFYTNYESNKGRVLAANPKAALVFFWQELQRQVRVEGNVILASASESDRYFASRDRGSQVGAWASDQSRPIQNREELVRKAQEIEARYAGKPIPRPPHWGGYRVVPTRIEFWTGAEHRLHDRIVYERKTSAGNKSGWKITRLSP